MCDADEQFQSGLEALLAGLHPGCETLESQARERND
jgi:hypothetical protein